MFFHIRCRQSIFSRKSGKISYKRFLCENGRKVFRKTRNAIRNGEFYELISGLPVSSTSIFARFSSTSISFASVLFIDMIIFSSQYLVLSRFSLDVTIHFAREICVQIFQYDHAFSVLSWCMIFFSLHLNIYRKYYASEVFELLIVVFADVFYEQRKNRIWEHLRFFTIAKKRS